MKRNQGGFSVVAGLLIFIIVAIIGGTGWYVMQANKNTDATLNKAGLGTATKSAKKTAPAPAPQADPTANWTAYSSQSGQFSLKYPSTWVKLPNTQSVGHCQSDNSGQMYITSLTGDKRDENKLSGSIFPDLLSKVVSVDNVQGERLSGTSNGSGQGIGYGTDDKGAKVVIYLFYTNGQTYVASYYQNNYPDVLGDFDLMVTKTLKFSS
jgi:hypothetical protein